VIQDFVTVVGEMVTNLFVHGMSAMMAYAMDKAMQYIYITDLNFPIN